MVNAVLSERKVADSIPTISDIHTVGPCKKVVFACLANDVNLFPANVPTWEHDLLPLPLQLAALRNQCSINHEIEVSATLNIYCSIVSCVIYKTKYAHLESEKIFQ